MTSEPLISVVAIFHDMRREAARTLHSLSRNYQRGIEDISYEVLAVDSNSSMPLDARQTAAHGEEFSYHSYSSPHPSPVMAINWAAERARGRYLAVLVDGARILSPGVLKYTSSALRTCEHPFVHTLSWHLGPDLQTHWRVTGYDQSVEDALLKNTRWEEDGYRLFEISVLGGSSVQGFLGDIAESNFFLLERASFQRMGGMEPRFESPGGGLANLDFYRRALEASELKSVRLLGEGTFHQFHNGAATSAPPNAHWDRFQAEYQAIRGYPWQMPTGQRPVLLGELPPSARRFVGAASGTT